MAASFLNARHTGIKTGGNYANVDAYVSGQERLDIPWNESYTLSPAGVQVNLIVAATTVTGFIYVDGTNAATGQGDFPAAVSATFTAGTATAATDINTNSLGQVLNRVPIRDASTHEPIYYNNEFLVYGLLQASTGTTDHAAVVTTASSENLQISYCYNNSASVITLTPVTDTIEFDLYVMYARKYLPTAYMGSAAPDVVMIAGGSGPVRHSYLTLTGENASGFTYGVTASGTNYTQSGDVDCALGASATVFDGNEAIYIFMNGTYMLKGTGLDAVWVSTTSFSLNHILDSTDVLTVMTPLNPS